MIMTYEEIDKVLVGRNLMSKKYSNNTYLVRRDNDGNIALRYHQTDVVVYESNGDIILNSGGWYTKTTKERINAGIMNTPLTMWQVKGRWYLSNKRCSDDMRINMIPYQDGMVIHFDGSTNGQGKDHLKEDKALKKRVKKFAQLCADKLPLEKPNGGDCWFCYMVTAQGKNLGDSISDKINHLDRHIKDRYIVPSLVYNALKENGSGPIYFQGAFDTVPLGDSMLSIAKDQVKRSVYRYILKRYGLAI